MAIDISSIGMEGSEGFLSGLLGGKKTEREIRQKAQNEFFMRKARGETAFNETFEPDMVMDLLEKITEKGQVINQIEVTNREINQKVREGLNSISDADLSRISKQLQQVSKSTGQDFGITGDNRKEVEQSLIQNQKRIGGEINSQYSQQQSLISQFQTEAPHGMSKSFGELLGMIGSRRFDTQVNSMSAEDLMSQIASQQGGTEALGSIFQDIGIDSKETWTEEDFSKSMSGMKDVDREKFEEEARQRLPGLFYEQLKRVMSDLAPRVEVQNQIMKSLEKFSSDTFNAVVEELGRNNRLTPQESAELLQMSQEEAVEQFGSRMSANIAQLRYGDFDPKNLDTFMGGARGAGGGITPRGGSSSGGSGGSDEGGGNAGTDNEDSNIFENNVFKNNTFGGLGGTPSGGEQESGAGTSGLAAAAAAYTLGGQTSGIKGANPQEEAGISQIENRMKEEEQTKRDAKTQRMSRVGAGIGASLAVGQFASGLSTPGGGPAAQEMAQGGSQMIGMALPAMAALTMNPALIAGAAIAAPLVQEAIGSMTQPYMNFVAQQKQYESITGENLQGEGAEQSGFGDFISSTGLTGDDGSIQRAQAGARMQNPFLETEKIQTLTDELLRLGATSEEAANMIRPVSEVIANTGISSEVAATLARTGMVELNEEGEGEGLGIKNLDFIAKEMQRIASQGEITQEEVQESVATASQEAGPSIGYESAQDVTLGLNEFYGGMSPNTVQVLRDTGSMQALTSTPSEAREDPLARMWMDTQDPRSKEWDTEYHRKRVEAIKEVASRIDPNDVFGSIERAQRDPRLGFFTQGLDPDAIIELAEEEGFVPEGVTSAIEGEEEAREEAEVEQKRVAHGEVGVKDPMSIRQSGGGEATEKGFGGMVNRIPFGIGGAIGKAMKGEMSEEEWNRTYTEEGLVKADVGGVNADIVQASQRHQEQQGNKGVGVTGMLARTDENFDPSTLQLEGTNKTFAEAANDPEMLADIESGDQKIMMGNRAITARELSLRHEQGEAFVDEKGMLRSGRAPDKGGDGEGRQTVKVEFTGLAEDYFKRVDLDDEKNVGGQVDGAYRTRDANSGTPEHGGNR